MSLIPRRMHPRVGTRIATGKLRPGKEHWIAVAGPAYHLKRRLYACATQGGSTPMMNTLPALIIAWAVVTGLFLALLAYNGTITRYEDNQLFLADINANEQQRQSVIVRRVNKTLPYVRVLGMLSGILTVLIIGIYTWDSWKQLHQ
jgi:hypothetical protein